MSDLREFLDRGVAGAGEVDLVEGVWRTSRRRRRNRRLGAGSAVAAVVAGAVVVSQWGGAGPSPDDLAPAEHTLSTPTVSEPSPEPTAATDQLAANQRFLEAIRSSGIALDYEPMESPEWAVSGGRQALVGEVLGVRASGDGFVVSVGVRQTIPDAFGFEEVDVRVSSGTLHDLTQTDLDAVGGPVLVVLPIGRSDAPTPEVFNPHTDGFWLDVPDGIGNPHVSWADMTPAWPQVDSVAELAGVLTAALPVAEPMPGIECSASYQNPPFVNGTGLTPAALDAADRLFADAGNCDREALVARAASDGTEVAIGDGDLEDQLAIPDPTGAYIGLAGTLTREPTTSEDGRLHTFDSNGWRVVIDSSGRWVEFTSGHVTYPVLQVALAEAWDSAPRWDKGAAIWRSWATGSDPDQVRVEASQGPCCLAVDGDRFALVDINNQRLLYGEGSGDTETVDLPVALRGVLAAELVEDSLTLAGTRDGQVWTALYSVATGTPQLIATVAHPDSPSLQDQLTVDSFGRVWFHELVGEELGDWVRADDPRERRAHRPLPDGSLLEIVHDESSVQLLLRAHDGPVERAWVMDQHVVVEDVELVGADLLVVIADADKPRAVVRLTPDGGEVLGTAVRPVEPYVEPGGSWEWRSPTSLLLLRATEDGVEVLDLPAG